MTYKFRISATEDLFIKIGNGKFDYGAEYVDINNLPICRGNAESKYASDGLLIKSQITGIFQTDSLGGYVEPLTPGDSKHPVLINPDSLQPSVNALAIGLTLGPQTILVAPNDLDPNDDQTTTFYLEKHPIGFDPDSNGSISAISEQIDDLMVRVNDSTNAWENVTKSCKLQLGYAHITFDITGARESSEGTYDWSFSITNVVIDIRTQDSDVNKYLNSYQLSFDALFSQSKLRNRIRLTYGYGIGEVGMNMFKSIRVSTSGGLNSGDSLTAEFVYPYTAQYKLNGYKVNTQVIEVDGAVMNFPPLDIHAARLVMNRR